MKSTFEEMGGTYSRVGDYFIPDLVLDDEPEYQIGKYGRMRERYLKEHRRTAYAELKLSGNVDIREVSLAFRGSDRVGELLVAEGESVPDARHPMMEVHLKLPKEAPRLSILRKRR